MDAGGRLAELPVAKDGKGAPRDRARQATEGSQHRVLQIPRRQGQVAVGTPGLAEQLAGEELLGLRRVERLDPAHLPPQEHAHPVAVRGVVAQLLPGGRLQGVRVQEADRRIPLQGLLRQRLEVDDVAVEPGLAAAAEVGRCQGLDQEHRVAVGRLGGGHQDPPGRLDLDGEKSPVVAGQAVLPDDLHVTLMRANLQPAHPKIDLLRPAGFERDDLLAPFPGLPLGFGRLLGICLQQVQFDRALAAGAGVGKLGFDSQGAAVAEHLRREPQFIQAEVGGLLDPHVDHVDPGAARAGEAVVEPGRRLARPGHPGQIGEDVNLPAGQLACAQQPQGLVQNSGRRLRVGHRLQPLDAMLGGPAIHLERRRARPAVEHGHPATLRKLPQQPEAQLPGDLQPRAVLVPVLHPHRGVEHQGRRHRGFLAPQCAGQPGGRPGQRKSQQQNGRNPQRQQQQVPQPQSPPVRVVPPLYEPQRRKLEPPRLLTHPQVQHDRQHRQTGSGQQEQRVDEGDHGGAVLRSLFLSFRREASEREKLLATTARAGRVSSPPTAVGGRFYTSHPLTTNH